MPSTYELVSSNVLTTAASSVTFSAIPSTYTDLVLRASARGSDSGNNAPFNIQINGDTGSNYSRIRTYGYNGTAYSNLSASATAYVDSAFFNLGTTTADTFASIELYIPNYLSTASKQISGSNAMENNATTAINDMHAVLYRGTSPVTSLAFIHASGDYVAGSSFYLYGIKNS